MLEARGEVPSVFWRGHIQVFPKRAQPSGSFFAEVVPIYMPNERGTRFMRKMYSLEIRHNHGLRRGDSNVGAFACRRSSGQACKRSTPA